ncbi:MAG: hypothetical protein ACM3VV_00480 [Deltaproteobacteria bacterium]
MSLSLSLILLSNGGSIAFQQEANAQNNASSLSKSQIIDEN